MSTVLFAHVGSLWTVRFRYDSQLVEQVKTVVPSYARSWTASAKHWTVAAEYADTSRRPCANSDTR